MVAIFITALVIVFVIAMVTVIATIIAIANSMLQVSWQFSCSLAVESECLSQL
jgi:hypothetical protein